MLSVIYTEIFKWKFCDDGELLPNEIEEYVRGRLAMAQDWAGFGPFCKVVGLSGLILLVDFCISLKVTKVKIK